MGRRAGVSLEYVHYAGRGSTCAATRTRVRLPASPQHLPLNRPLGRLRGFSFVGGSEIGQDGPQTRLCENRCGTATPAFCPPRVVVRPSPTPLLGLHREPGPLAGLVGAAARESPAPDPPERAERTRPVRRRRAGGKRASLRSGAVRKPGLLGVEEGGSLPAGGALPVGRRAQSSLTQES
jgi:hypothetical protein